MCLQTYFEASYTSYKQERFNLTIATSQIHVPSYMYVQVLFVAAYWGIADLTFGRA